MENSPQNIRGYMDIFTVYCVSQCGVDAQLILRAEATSQTDK